MLASTVLYEQLLAIPFDKLDVDAACGRWPEWNDAVKFALAMFEGTDFPTIGQSAKVGSTVGLITFLAMAECGRLKKNSTFVFDSMVNL